MKHVVLVALWCQPNNPIHVFGPLAQSKDWCSPLPIAVTFSRVADSVSRELPVRSSGHEADGVPTVN